MDPQHIQRTLDLILGQLGTVTQQIRDTQGELADFRRQAGKQLDNIERLGNTAIYTPSRPHSPYGRFEGPLKLEMSHMMAIGFFTHPVLQFNVGSEFLTFRIEAALSFKPLPASPDIVLCTSPSTWPSPDPCNRRTSPPVS
ncbi:hypothetical protein M5K25_012037 [Dendrobium thyrsiflorum]|uniref:Uncharacterized protein n=1 Tax=Dendrobium thyrsiflorum TaxID=117978 RepID=A0ABD0VBE5_DENTH